MSAATGAGWFAGVPAAAEAMCGGITRVTHPSASRVPRNAELLEIYREVYPQLRQTYRKLKAFGTRC